jgi:hypothetical protein
MPVHGVMSSCLPAKATFLREKATNRMRFSRVTKLSFRQLTKSSASERSLFAICLYGCPTLGSFVRVGNERHWIVVILSIFRVPGIRACERGVLAH